MGGGHLNPQFSVYCVLHTMFKDFHSASAPSATDTVFYSSAEERSVSLQYSPPRPYTALSHPWFELQEVGHL